MRHSPIEINRGMLKYNLKTNRKFNRSSKKYYHLILPLTSFNELKIS